MLEKNKRITILEGNVQNRLPILSLYVEDIHYQLMVKLMNDVHGIQLRGGCSCAGTYGYYLLNVDQQQSKFITNEIEKGNLYVKPGGVRISLHPTMAEEDIVYIAEGISDVINGIERYRKDYKYIPETNDFQYRNEHALHYHYWYN